ncbi:hypothetical protein FQN57_003562 [Myotisia sp. PD_48]|nr:hypothetical protein FQN57_003562 [Myotisia sp. PD_48]
MRGVQIFSGTSHPSLTEAVCERLGTVPATCELRKFSNGETSVNIGVSVRNQDVYIVQSGSSKINDSVMELLIMISACKGGSAKSITAVMPYFPYSRQSKKKSHRGAITARMLANLLSVAGVDHVVTVDLHEYLLTAIGFFFLLKASQMQGFFGKPVDNLFAEPLIARWIRSNVPGWTEAVVVTKNAGGSKRVTSLADALKLNFGIVTTDRRRNKKYKNKSMTDSAIFFDSVEQGFPGLREELKASSTAAKRPTFSTSNQENIPLTTNMIPSPIPENSSTASNNDASIISTPSESHFASENCATPQPDSPFTQSYFEKSLSTEYTDERAREVITGRLVKGHLVDDDYPSPETSSATLASETVVAARSDASEGSAADSMSMSVMSTMSSFHPEHALGGSFDAAASSDEEEVIKYSEHERMITLVGDVRDKTVFIVDDMIDKSSSWIAAAETVVKKGGAKKVYCIATHGLFGDSSMEQMEACNSIDYIVITNSFPIPEKAKTMKKLIILDLSALLSESIRRHHNGESISALFQLHD